MELSARFRLSRGALELDVELDVASGESTALVGPNGAGKSSLLAVLAGLLRIDSGRVELGGELLDGGRGGAFVPPERRASGVVFQDRVLFPHLSVLDNVAYGLRARGADRAEARAAAGEWLARVGLAGLADRSPAGLSGGEGQRVALARALASAPRMLLLDEPLSAVDVTARAALRAELRAHLADFRGVRLIVVHDAVDAFALAERVVVLEAGRVRQAGTVAEICSRPRSPYVADLVGLNLLRGEVREGVLEVPGGRRWFVSTPLAGPVLATVHPRSIALFRARPDGSPRNVWRAPVAALEPAGPAIRVQLGGGPPLVAEVTPAAVAELALGAGGDVWCAIKATEIAVYPA